MKTSQLKSWAVFAIPLLIVIGLFVALAASQPKSGSVTGDEPHADILASCIQHTNVSLHIHPELTIMINGEKQVIPANVGIDPGGCMHPVHTHDASGQVHIEYLYPVDFTLGDFFAIWGKEFSSTNLMGTEADATHAVTMTVNGQPSSAYENLVLKDKDKIAVSYEEIIPESDEAASDLENPAE
jgi:hypothetical protein